MSTTTTAATMMINRTMLSPVPRKLSLLLLPSLDAGAIVVGSQFPVPLTHGRTEVSKFVRGPMKLLPDFWYLLCKHFS